ncbi:MAG: peptidoglycan-binding protein [Rhizobacter sp.]
MNTQDAMQFESLPFDPSPRRRARSAARRAGGGQGGGSSGCGCGQSSGAAAEIDPEFDGEWGYGSGESEDETDAEFDGEQDSEFEAEFDSEMPGQEETEDEFDSERARMARGGPRGASRAGRAGLRPPQRFRPPQAGRPRARPRGPGAAFGWNPIVGPAEPAAPCVCPSHGSEFARWVQSTLNRVAGAGLPVNGAMNAATRRAVRTFQARRGLPVDGIVGPETEQALRAARLEGSGTVAGDEDEPQSEFGADFELDEMNDGEAEAFESPAPRRVLRSGSRGTDVSDLQRRLNAAGFDSGAVDGVFGTRTDRAVRAFQAARRLSVDGIVGSQTWAALLGGSSVPVPVVTADRWAIPASVREAAQAQYVRYDSPPAWAGNPGNCTGTFTDGARILKEYIEQNFSGVTSIGGYSCRANTANTAETSVHGVGRALDIMITPVGGRANAAVGDRIANWLLQNAAAIGVQYVIWNRVRWNGSVRSGSKDAPYTGPNPHIDHVHAEINLDAATRRTPWFRGR